MEGKTKKMTENNKYANGNGVSKDKVEKKMKSTAVAYFFWFFGGFFGAHHLYLGRLEQAVVWATTLGGYFGLGVFRDMWRLSDYVKDANEEPQYIEFFKLTVKHNKKPQFSTARFLGAIATGHFWGELFTYGIPEDEIYGINFRSLFVLVPAVVAAGVWTVGNIGREQGTIWLSLISAYAMYPLLYYIGDDSTWLNLTTVVTALVFDTFSKEWRLRPRKKKTAKRLISIYTICVLIYAGLFASYFYFNATITDSEGEEIKITEAIKHFFTSPVWLNFQASLWTTYEQAKSEGFWATWRKLVDLSDPRGEINAYKVLGLSKTASESEITTKWRTLSKEHHPDKVKGNDEERKAAQERFMEIQQAYEILSKTKSRRQRKNRRAG